MSSPSLQVAMQLGSIQQLDESRRQFLLGRAEGILQTFRDDPGMIVAYKLALAQYDLEKENDQRT